MSDTPRTDDRVLYAEEIGVNSNRSEWVNAPFARGLERELNAANERIKHLEEENDAMKSDRKAEPCDGDASKDPSVHECKVGLLKMIDMTNQIKCGHCGKFIAHKFLKKCKHIFTPDSDYSSEESYYLCAQCSKED